MPRVPPIVACAFAMLCIAAAPQTQPYEPPDQPRTAAQEQARQQSWSAVSPGLHAAVGSTDIRYPRDLPPTTLPADWSATAWRGERVNAQLVAWSTQPLHQLRVEPGPFRSPAGDALPADAMHASFVRYVLAAGISYPDVIDDAATLDLPAHSARPIWIQIDVPPDTKPGL